MELNKRRIGFLLLVTVVFMLALYFLVSDSEHWYTDVELEYIASIPNSNDNVFLANPVGFSFSANQVFVSDQKSSIIYVFDYNGNYISQFGGAGSGPGEFLMPGSINYYDEKLFINDIANGRLVIFDIEKDHFEYFFPNQIPREIVVTDQNIFMNHLLSSSQLNTNELDLLYSYDWEMNLITSFGEHLNFMENMPTRASTVHLEKYGSYLYVLFNYYPFLRVYDFDGQLVKEYDLTERYKRLIPENYQTSAFADPSVLNLNNLFNGLDVSDEGLFLYVVEKKGHVIDYFDHEGNFQQRLRPNITSESYFIRDTELLEKENGDHHFYLLGISNNQSRIDYFKWTN